MAQCPRVAGCPYADTSFRLAWESELTSLSPGCTGWAAGWGGTQSERARQPIFTRQVSVSPRRASGDGVGMELGCVGPPGACKGEGSRQAGLQALATPPQGLPPQGLPRGPAHAVLKLTSTQLKMRAGTTAPGHRQPFAQSIQNPASSSLHEPPQPPPNTETLGQISGSSAPRAASSQAAQAATALYPTHPQPAEPSAPGSRAQLAVPLPRVLPPHLCASVVSKVWPPSLCAADRAHAALTGSLSIWRAGL